MNTNEIFGRLLDSSDEFVRLKSTVIASIFLSSDPSPTDEVVDKLLLHLSSLIRKSYSILESRVMPIDLTLVRKLIGNDKETEGQDVGVQCLEGVLRLEKVRTAVWATESTTSEAPKVIEG